MPGHLATRRERDHDGASIIVIMEATQDRTPHSLYVVCIGAMAACGASTAGSDQTGGTATATSGGSGSTPTATTTGGGGSSTATPSGSGTPDAVSAAILLHRARDGQQ